MLPVLAAFWFTAAPTLQDYRYFRALSIDLNGRIPTADELAAFESGSLDTASFIEQHLSSATYADRLTRVYMDAMRLQAGSSIQYVQNQNLVRRQQVLVDFDGTPKVVNVYFRQGQRRDDVALDGTFCFQQSETNQQYASIKAPVPPTTGPSGEVTAGVVAVSGALFAERTVSVKPWWLYTDYKATAPAQVYTLAAGLTQGFVLNNSMLGDGSSVYVCKEEAALSDTGHVFLRADNSQAGQRPFGRLDSVPGNSGYAKSHSGEAVACGTALGVANAIDCGCGVGLERCMPIDGPGFDGSPFFLPRYTPLGPEAYFGERTQTGDPVASPGTNVSQNELARMTWGEEARRFFGDVFVNDVDFRQVLSAKFSYVNGPLAQYYRHFAAQTCCNDQFATTFSYTSPQPLFAPAALPDISPQAINDWRKVADRGPLASGVLTMPVTCLRFAAIRARTCYREDPSCSRRPA